MKRFFLTSLVVLWAMTQCLAQERQQAKPIPPIVDPYSRWIEVRADNGGFIGLFPTAPKYSKSYEEHVVTRDFTGLLSANEGVNYEVVYLEFDYVASLTASEFLKGTLKGAPDSRVIASVPISVNKIEGIEATVKDPSVGYSKLLCFVSGAEVYVLNFSAKTEQKLSADQIGYFVRHFKMQPTPVLLPPDTRRAKSPAILDVDPELLKTKPPAQPSGTGLGSSDSSRIYSPSEITQKARVIEKPDPQYTGPAQDHQIEGTVVLRAVFAANGEVTNVQVLKGLPYGLTEEAVAAAKRIKFIPAMKDGHAVSLYVQIDYRFELK
jgi:TonB family protein